MFWPEERRIVFWLVGHQVVFGPVGYQVVFELVEWRKVPAPIERWIAVESIAARS